MRLNISRTLFVLSAAATIVTGCRQKPEPLLEIEETVRYSDAPAKLSAAVRPEQITVIPLETNKAAMVNSEAEMFTAGGDYYVVDTKKASVLRFDSAGRFLNSVGRRGRGPNEYIGIENAWFDPRLGQICVYSYANSAIYNYSREGTFVTKNTLSYQAPQVLRTNDTYWYYMGYGNGTMPERLIRTRGDNDRIEGKYLTARAKILPMSGPERNITEGPGGIYIMDMSDPNIYRIDGEDQSIAFRVDYGKYAIPEDYYTMDDRIEAGKLLLSSDFATNSFFAINGGHAVIQAIIERTAGEGVILATGIKELKSDRWKWYNYDMKQDAADIFAGRAKALTDDSQLLYLVDPYKLLALDGADSLLRENMEAVGALQKNSNCAILKYRLD